MIDEELKFLFEIKTMDELTNTCLLEQIQGVLIVFQSRCVRSRSRHFTGLLKRLTVTLKHRQLKIQSVSVMPTAMLAGDPG